MGRCGQKQPEAIPERTRPPLQPSCSPGPQARPRLSSCLNPFNDFTVAWCRLYINSKVLLTQPLGLVRGQRSPGETQAGARPARQRPGPSDSVAVEMVGIDVVTSPLTHWLRAWARESG